METVTRAARAAMAVRWIWLAAKLGNASGGHTPLHAAGVVGVIGGGAATSLGSARHRS